MVARPLVLRASAPMTSETSEQCSPWVPDPSDPVRLPSHRGADGSAVRNFGDLDLLGLGHATPHRCSPNHARPLVQGGLSHALLTRLSGWSARARCETGFEDLFAVRL